MLEKIKLPRKRGKEEKEMRKINNKSERERKSS
jgi:hypothetical protein